MSNNVYQVLFGASLTENIQLFEQALACCPSFAVVHRVGGISDLVSYLAGTGNFIDKTVYPQPDLVLLDLNLSGPRSGFEVLRWIQAQPLRRYRVVIFSSRLDEDECEQAYALGADGFVSKPRSVAEMIKVLTRIEGWLKSSIVEDAEQFCAA